MTIINLRRKLYKFGLLFGGGILLYQSYMGIRALTLKNVTFQEGENLLFGLILIIGAIILSILAWTFIMASKGARFPFWRGVKIYMLSFLPRYIPGMIWGYLSRNESLLVSFGINYRISNIGTLYELLSGVTSGVVVGGILYFNLMAAENLRWLAISFIPIPIVVIYIADYFTYNRNFLKLNSVFENNSRSKIEWLISTSILSINWLFYGAMIYFCFQSLGIKFEQNTFQLLLQMTLIYCVAWIIGFFTFIFPSGVGIRELTIAGLLVSIIGVEFELASIIALLARLVVILAEMFWVGFAVILNWFDKNQERNRFLSFRGDKL